MYSIDLNEFNWQFCTIVEDIEIVSVGTSQHWVVFGRLKACDGSQQRLCLIMELECGELQAFALALIQS